ncbi:MAG: MerR family transcriptional regulator [Pseudomonadota bacterium]|nr:MerR family transcriptional regulator [Pseudomonadota bacterium]
MSEEFSTNTGTGKSATAFRTISEVSVELDIPQHVLRFWETKFTQLKPMKRGGGRRYYRPGDIALIKRIHTLLYDDGYTIKGVQKVLAEGREEAVSGTTEEPPLLLTRQQMVPPKSSIAAKPLSDKARQGLSGILDELRALKDIVATEED